MDGQGNGGTGGQRKERREGQIEKEKEGGMEGGKNREREGGGTDRGREGAVEKGKEGGRRANAVKQARSAPCLFMYHPRDKIWFNNSSRICFHLVLIN